MNLAMNKMVGRAPMTPQGGNVYQGTLDQKPLNGMQPVTSDAIGGGLARPTLMAPGNRIQQIDMGPAPTQPGGFKFPSQMWTE
jgi:hypothetical protein